MMYVLGRPLDVSEVNKLWGNGMGDLGPMRGLRWTVSLGPIRYLAGSFSINR